LPAGWTAADVGSPTIAGSARHATGTFTLEGAGTDIWNRADQFHFVYQPVTGDVEIVSRVRSVEYTDEWAKAGVMIREALTADAPHASVLFTAATRVSFTRRAAAGGITDGTTLGTAPAPVWVRLARRGSTVTAYDSSDGVTWRTVGTMTLAGSTVYVGLAVTSHNVGTAATAVFEDVTLQPPTEPLNQPPTAALTAPANGATFTAPATIDVSASAGDTDGTVARVDFYAGTTLIGSDTTSPYSISWTGVPAGSYTLTAVARDDDGAATTSAARSITVTGASGATYRALFTASRNHGTAVTRYQLEVFAATSNPATAPPLAARDIGKPAVVNGEITVDVTGTIGALPPGSYVATVTAIGDGGSARSAPSPAFAR
jgi:regulation of enolase protein 1 (concanavalin A-like superfamily)